ncbi:MAG: hypothetical protein Q8L20_10735 [Gammaproteobacteria bacterium]|nr:hypothetical protein [Gammaproteobacteria bacterium]
MNSAWKYARFADVIYAGDDCWWEQYGAEIDIPAERWTCLENTALTYGINRHGKFRGVTNSGAMAIQFSIDAGAARVLMLGYDCSVARGTHFHGDHLKTKNPDEKRCQQWQVHFSALAAHAENAGTTIINCSKETALACFVRMPLAAALRVSGVNCD